MRRTYQDMCRDAQVDDKVTRLISGHATPEMQQLYSTIRHDEVRSELGKVVSLVGFKHALALEARGQPTASVATAGASGAESGAEAAKAP